MPNPMRKRRTSAARTASKSSTENKSSNSCTVGCCSGNNSNCKSKPSSGKKARTATSRLRKPPPSIAKHPPAVPSNLGDQQQFDDFYNQFVEAAEAVPSGQHTSIADLLKLPLMKRLIQTIFILSTLPNRDSKRDKIDYDYVKLMFSRFGGVDISSFREEEEEQLKEMLGDMKLNEFMHMMFVYTARYKQERCACCGRDIIDSVFGAIGFESNHWGNDQDDEELHLKLFEICSGNFGRKFVDILWELCKTRLECWSCHNRYGPYKYQSLPNKCYGDYSDYTKPRPCFEVQLSKECRDLYKVCCRLLDTNIMSLSHNNIMEAIHKDTIFDPRDAVLFNEQEWEIELGTDTDTRRRMIKRIYLQGEKRLSGGCFLCDEEHANSPLRDIPGVDNDHLCPDKKRFNPSEGIRYSLDTARDENKKCCPLCKKCHMRITHSKSAKAEYERKLKAAGYQWSKTTGFLSWKKKK